MRTFTPGDGTSLLHTALGDAAVVICFKAIFPDLVRRQMALGADVLVNLSNDVWLGRNTGPEQHLLMATLRAVENRTWLIRATTTGISAIVDPYGRVQARTDTFVAATINADIVPMRVDTVYKRYGDIFAYARVGSFTHRIVCALEGSPIATRSPLRLAGRDARPTSLDLQIFGRSSDLH